MAHNRKQAEAARNQVLGQLLACVDREEPLVVLRAPPGSGKTYLTIRAAALAHIGGKRVAVACQTNAQADDFARRLAVTFPSIAVVRFASGGADPVDLGPNVTWIAASKLVPTQGAVVISTSAKWGTCSLSFAFDYLLVDEAWQLAYSDFALLEQVAERFVLVGDPGQIPPVVDLDVSRWQTSPKPPHRPAPELLLADPSLGATVLSLPVTTRLPHDTARLLSGFYDFRFSSWAGPNERSLECRAARSSEKGIDDALDLLRSGSVAMLTLPTPASGVPLEDDAEVALAVARVVKRLLDRKAVALMESGREALTPGQIGVSATHRVMNTRLEEALVAELGTKAGEVRVDTPERWQGLERKVMVVVHPLSGVSDPSAFDLETGRLCVMASRHQVGLILVGRDHIGPMLEELLPVADQAVGTPDVAGRGHAQHQTFWSELEREGRIC